MGKRGPRLKKPKDKKTDAPPKPRCKWCNSPLGDMGDNFDEGYCRACWAEKTSPPLYDCPTDWCGLYWAEAPVGEKVWLRSMAGGKHNVTGPYRVVNPAGRILLDMQSRREFRHNGESLVKQAERLVL
jgi:hypothetical protein